MPDFQFGSAVSQPLTNRHAELEDEFHDLLESAGLPAPDETGHFRRAVAFLWYDSKAFVLVDLNKVPRHGPAFGGLDLDALEDEILGPPPLPFEPLSPFAPGPGFAETG